MLIVSDFFLFIYVFIIFALQLNVSCLLMFSFVQPLKKVYHSAMSPKFAQNLTKKLLFKKVKL